MINLISVFCVYTKLETVSNDIIFYYEDIENLDGLIPFASDGCGIAFAFDKKSEEIVSIPMDCLERNYAKIIAVNYDDFIDRICSHKLQY